MSKIFLNIPESIEDKIMELEVEEFSSVYRAIRHLGEFRPEDFYPYFDDPYKKSNNESMSSKGGMANIIASQGGDIGMYSLSLFVNKKAIKDVFWRRHKRDFPVIAIGHTDSNKGLAHLDNDSHVSYYLFDYKNEQKNPYKDFIKDECIDE